MSNLLASAADVAGWLTVLTSYMQRIVFHDLLPGAEVEEAIRQVEEAIAAYRAAVGEVDQ